MTFSLKIVTPDGLIFDGQAQKLIVRTITGDCAILARHIDYVVPLGMGRAVVETESERKLAACIGGMLSVHNGEVTLVPTTFEWADQIDVDRAIAAHAKAEKILANHNASDNDIRLAKAKLRRSLLRQNVASYK